MLAWSVDSDCWRYVLSPEILFIVWSFDCHCSRSHVKPALGRRRSWGDSTGVWDHIKGRRGKYGNTGGPPVAIRKEVRRVCPSIKIQALQVSNSLVMALRKELHLWRQKSRETEEDGHNEGSLSIFIVLLKAGESALWKPANREGRCLFYGAAF